MIRKSGPLLHLILYSFVTTVLLLFFISRKVQTLLNDVSSNNQLLRSRVSENYDVTVLTHSSTQRLFFIPYIVDRWKGPISMTVYLKSGEDEELLNTLIRNRFFPKLVHVVQYFSPTPTEYPYNKLRNMALRDISTSHFWVMDMDMWPSENLHVSLMSLDSRYLNDDYLAVIVPSFEYKKDMSACNGFEECVNEVIPYIPLTFRDLENCISMQKCDEFRKDYYVHNYFSPEWYNKDSNQQLLLVPCFKSRKQEPYVMVKRSAHMPVFDERFVNYGKDKISWIEALRYSGYKFAVLRNAFAVDIPHPRSDYAQEFFNVVLNQGAEKWDMNIVYNQFLKELYKKRDNSIVYICDKSNNAVYLCLQQTQHNLHFVLDIDRVSNEELLRFGHAHYNRRVHTIIHKLLHLFFTLMESIGVQMRSQNLEFLSREFHSSEFLWNLILNRLEIFA